MPPSTLMANSALRSILCFLLCSLLAPRTLNEAVGMEKPLSFPRHEGDAAAKLLGRVMKASREQVRLVLEPGMHTLRESKGADNEPLTLSVVKHDMDYDVFKEHCKRSFPDNQTREEDMGPHDLFDILDSTPTANHPAFSASPPGSQMVQPDLAGSNDGSDEAGNPLRYLPGILSPSCCLPPTSRLLLRGNSSHDQKPQVEGSWKLLNSSRGVLEQVHFSNQHGSIFEVLSGPWEFRSCRLAAAGPWLVGPVCIFGRCEALINVSDCRFGRLETGRKRDVAHHGVAASGKTVCRVKNSCMEEFRMSDVSATDESSVSLSNSVLQYSNFAVSLASQARVKLESCELRDHNYSAFICPERQRCHLVSKNVSILGRVWHLPFRPEGTKPQTNSLTLSPPMAIPGREDTRWEFPETYVNGRTELDDRVFDDHLLALPSSCSEYEEDEGFASQLRRAIEAEAQQGRPVAPANFSSFVSDVLGSMKLDVFA